MSDRVYLSVYEQVVVVESGIHRERYSYYLIVDDDEEWGSIATRLTPLRFTGTSGPITSGCPRRA